MIGLLFYMSYPIRRKIAKSHHAKNWSIVSGN